MKLLGNAVWRDGGYQCAALKKSDLLRGRQGTVAYQILNVHQWGKDPEVCRIRFDSLISHDITYVGILQTAVAAGLREFSVPYVLTNCHNSLCAVGGTINEDDHRFGLSAAVKFGGIYVPANLAVIHQYARECMAGCGRMILGSDSHTRYGALGCMGIGEGGPELVRQLLGGYYEITAPEVVLVWLSGSLRRGVGPHDAALALCAAVYESGFAKNRILEFAGPGVKNLSMDERLGVDVMTTETACLSSVWITDSKTADYLALHGRPESYRPLMPENGACYDRVIDMDLSEIEPMIALPFHPSLAYPIREFLDHAEDLLRETEKRAQEQIGRAAPKWTQKVRGKKVFVDQGIIAGCAGGLYENLAHTAAILRGGSAGSGGFSLSVYPASVPVETELIKNGVAEELLSSGVMLKPCFCGPCFGAGDVPHNGALSIRHTTRNFPNREGSRPQDGQFSAVLLMDARSIAATARNGGILTSAMETEYEEPAAVPRTFDDRAYRHRVYCGVGAPEPEQPLRYAPGIAPWPQIPELSEHLLLELAAVIHDKVTTTDELIPSGETSSYRSDPMRLAEYTLSRTVPDYVSRAKAVAQREKDRAAGKTEWVKEILKRMAVDPALAAETRIASAIFAEHPGDGSAREQAAACQRVLGGGANLCRSYATKRYRSNCINWGILPFTVEEGFDHPAGTVLFVPGIRTALLRRKKQVEATVLDGEKVEKLILRLGELNEEETGMLLDGCLINSYAKRGGKP